MGQNPFNLALRFLLELVALFAVGYWGWHSGTGAGRYLLAIGLPLIAAAVWAVFRVPGDASASGNAPVAVPGWTRLLLELALFVCAAWGLFAAGARLPASIFAVVVVLHYALSYDRIAWLLQR